MLCNVLSCVMLFIVLLFNVVLCCVMLCFVIFCYVVLCYVMLNHVMLCYVLRRVLGASVVLTGYLSLTRAALHACATAMRVLLLLLLLAKIRCQLGCRYFVR